MDRETLQSASRNSTNPTANQSLDELLHNNAVGNGVCATDSVTPNGRTTPTDMCSDQSQDAGSDSTDVPELQFVLEASQTQPKPVILSPFPPPGEFGYGNPFLLCASLSMILQQRDYVMKNKLDFESIAMLFDRSVRKNDVGRILMETKMVYEDYIRRDQMHHDCDSGYVIKV